ncbi:MAG: VanZ family protein [Deltaproteobacteria bacterium]|nr:VanZ family protein [Deltaproteobacteria bacterium]
MKKVFLYKAGVSAFMGIVLVLSTIADANPLPSYDNIDKVYHFAAYLVMGWLWAGVFLNSFFFKEKGRAWAAAASFGISFVFGAAMEITQRYLPGRAAETGDLIANGAGALAGAVIQMYAYKLKGRPGHET